jgi:hypothetical protein
LPEAEIEVAQDLGARAVAQADAVEFDDGRQLNFLPLSAAYRARSTPCHMRRIPVYPALTVPEEAFC